MTPLEYIDMEIERVSKRLRDAIGWTRSWLDDVERGIDHGYVGGTNIMADHDVWTESGRFKAQDQINYFEGLEEAATALAAIRSDLEAFDRLCARILRDAGKEL